MATNPSPCSGLLVRARIIRLAVLVVVGSAGWPATAFQMDPTKITATCAVSNSAKGPFSATDPVTLLTGTDLFVLMNYRHDDTNSAVYSARFTAAILTSGSFGLGRTIDTHVLSGGSGVSTGSNRLIALRSGAGTATNAVVIRVTSDVTGSMVLARCDFLLEPVQMDDDIDKDGIPNDVERFGLLDPATGQLLTGSNGKPVADFPSLGANPCRKDIAVEIDYQTGANHTHQPTTAALNEVKNAFAKAPLPGSPGCPFDGFEALPGINLITDIDGAIPEATTVDDQGRTSVVPWNCAAAGPFEQARAPYFRHSIWVHSVPQQFSGLTPCSGGIGVALGLFPIGTRFEAGTFMHELGHGLGLGHGGDSGINLKPNYLSVMNYSFQEGIPDDGNGFVDYSRAVLPELAEGALSETVGLLGPAHVKTIWWVYTKSQTGNAQGALDWNGSGRIDSTPVSADVNRDAVCVGPGANSLRETNPEGDDVVALNYVFNGPNRACDTQPCNRGVDGCDDTLNALACIAPGANGQLDTPAAGDDDQLNAALPCITSGANRQLDTLAAGDDLQSGAVIVAGANTVCDTTAIGDDFQFTMPGQSEPRVLGHDDWNAVGRNLVHGAGVSLIDQPQPNWTPEERELILRSRDPNADVSAPTTFGTPVQAPNSAGWFRSDVTVTLSAIDPDGVDDVAAIGYRVSGPQPIAPSWVPGASTSIQISAEGRTAVTFYSSDRVGNTDAATTLRLNIDKTAPVLQMPALAATMTYNGAVTLTFDARDAQSGLASQQATFNGTPVTSGTALTLTHLGTNTFTLTATDIAGHTATQTLTFSVVYRFGGFLPPVPNDGSGVYKLASVVPVKFQLTDASGTVVSTAIAHLTLQMLSGGTPVGSAIDATPPGAADTGSSFRCHETQYIYNLSTKPLSSGLWQIQVHLDDGTVHTVSIGLK